MGVRRGKRIKWRRKKGQEVKCELELQETKHRNSYPTEPSWEGS